MEPLIDKLARQKPVRMIFETIRRWDKQSEKSPNVPVIRFIGSTICIMALTFGLFILALALPDDPKPYSYISCVMTVGWAVIAWPFVAIGVIFPGDPPDFLIVPIWTLTGLFWATVIELFIKWKKRKRPSMKEEGASPK
jgi:hypothetical protein